jgi:hypothetical protein
MDPKVCGSNLMLLVSVWAVNTNVGKQVSKLDHICTACGNKELRKNPCSTVAHVVIQAIVVRFEARPGFELVTQVSGFKPDKLLTKPVLHLRNLQEFVKH